MTTTQSRTPTKASFLPLATRQAPGFATRSFNAESRTIDLVWTTGAAVRRYDYQAGRYYKEELEVTPEAVNFSRLSNGAPLLNSHGRYSLEDQIGVVESASLRNGEGIATVRLSGRESNAGIVQDVADGVIRGVSVGYTIERVEQISPIDDDGDWTYRAVAWTPIEISLVTVPADAGAGIRADDGVAKFAFDERGFPVMPEVNQTANPDPKHANPQPRTDPAELERARVSKILNLASDAGLEMDFTRNLIDQGLSVEDAGKRMIDELIDADGRSENQISGHIGAGSLKRSRSTLAGSPIALMSQGLAARFGVPVDNDDARDFRGLSLADMARELLEMRGNRTTGMSRGEVIDAALGNGGARNMSTSDLPQLLLGAGDRILRRTFDSEGSQLKQIFRRSFASDFRTKMRVQLSETPDLREVLEGGEYQYGPVGESKEAYALTTYGRLLSLTRQALINDDLGAFDQIIRQFGQSAARKEADVLANLLAGNPTMDDSKTLFHAAHGNLASSGAAPSVETLSDARLAMRTQKGQDNTTIIAVTPRYLIVPASLETQAEQVLTSIQATAVSDVNPFNGKLELVVDPRLDGHSTTAWYVAADPSQIDTIEYAYLDEAAGPQIMTREGWSVDGVELKCRLDFGAGVMEWRGFYKNPGAGA